jgi:hypothetical protein
MPSVSRKLTKEHAVSGGGGRRKKIDTKWAYIAMAV